MNEVVQPPVTRTAPKWLIVTAAVAAMALALFAVAAPVLSSIARTKIQTILQDRFDSDLQIQNLKVTVFPSVAISGESVVFRRKGHSEEPPMIEIAKFTATGNLLSLLARHVGSARLDGLKIKIPPKDPSHVKTPADGSNPYFVIDEIIADGATVSTIPRERWKEPLVFDIKTLRIRGASSLSSLTFDAVLTNAKPPGEIRSQGNIGPWDKREPGDTPVSGKYTFRNADLGVFKGIAGTLSSDGSYKGSLVRLEATGHTDVPNFRVTLAGNPVHLVTDYQAIVDGTNGDTYLQPVTAKFGKSTIVATGSIEGQKGVRGKTVTLDATVQDGRLEDLLLLAYRSPPPTMSGAIGFHTKIVLPPGDVDVIEKLKLEGAFTAGAAQFSQLNFREKVAELSHRAAGHPEDVAEDGPTVAANFKGKFTLDRGQLSLRDLSFAVPGAVIALNGGYGMKARTLDFRGTATLEAKVSEMTTGFKSFLLKALDPLFKKKGSSAGAVIPLKISGTTDEPAFALDMFGGGR